jgi:type I restriction enzyme, S subunit
MVIGRGLSAIRFAAADQAFAWHSLKWSVGDLNRVAQGSTFVAVSRQDVETLEIPWCGDLCRRTIAAVLGTVDEAIAKTEAVIAKLEQVRAGLLHDLLTRGLDEHSQLRDPIAHPEQFKDSPLGRIPQGGKICRLGNALQVPPRNGYSPQEAPVFEGSYLLGLGCLSAEGFAPSQLKHAPSRNAGLAPFRLEDGDLLISRSNTRDLVGLTGVFRDVGYPCYYQDLMMRLIPKPELSAAYLDLVLRYSSSRAKLVASASGTSASMVKITGAGVMETIVAYPPLNELGEQKRILDIADTANNDLLKLSEEREKLTSLKSGLMSDLLTGRVRVPDGPIFTKST